MATAAIIRVLRRIDITEPGCWIWPGSHTPAGYGTVSIQEPKLSMLLVHRVTYEYFIADIPDGLELDHLCEEKLCCNPVHLEAVTHQVNAQRRSARTTHCPQNHPYDEANTYVDPRGFRGCRQCRKEATKRYVDHPRPGAAH